MGIKNLFTKEKKEVDEATRELNRQKRKDAIKEIVTTVGIVVGAIGTAGLVYYGITKLRNKASSSTPSDNSYEIAMDIISTIDNLKNDQMFLCTRQENETDKTWVIRKAVYTDTEAVKTFNDNIEAGLVEAKIQTPKIEG